MLEDWHGGVFSTALLVLSSVAGDCGINISLVEPTVLVSNTKNLLVEQGMCFIIDWPENPLGPSPTPWLVQPFWVYPLFPLLPQWPLP